MGKTFGVIHKVRTLARWRSGLAEIALAQVRYKTELK